MGFKSVTISVLILAFSSNAYSTGKGSNPNGKPFIELAGQIVEVEGEISSLQDQVDSLVGRVDSLESKVMANEGAIASLQNQNITLQATVDAYGSTTDSLQSQLTALEAENDNLLAQIEAGDANLQTQVDENNSLIISLQMSLSDISDLQAQIDNNANLISMMSSEIQQIQQGLALKQTIISGNCPDGFAVQAINTDGTVVCTSAGGEGSVTNLTSVFVVGQYDVAPNATHTTQDFCPTGYLASGAGLWWAFNVDIIGFYAVTGSGGVSYGFYRVRNHTNYITTYITATTCIK